MVRFDLVDQRTATYNLDYTSSVWFYLLTLFYLTNVASAANMMHQNEFTILGFKTMISTYLFDCYINRSRSPLENKTRSKRK